MDNIEGGCAMGRAMEALSRAHNLTPRQAATLVSGLGSEAIFALAEAEPKAAGEIPRAQ